MRPPSDSSRGGRTQRANPGEKLQQEPIAKDENSRDGHEKNENQGKDAFARIEDEVSAHDAGNGAAGAQRGKAGMQVEKNVEESSSYSAYKIEKQIREVPETVLDVVPEDPEKKHVAGEV